jgi:uncharacterized protein (DUF2267 family)
MELHHFLREVAERTGLDEPTAEFATTAVLSALAEHLTPDEARHLRSQLPGELQEPLIAGAGESFDWDELVRRVAERDDLSGSTARRVGEVVLGVLREAVDSGTYTRMLAQLPASFPPHDHVGETPQHGRRDVSRDRTDRGDGHVEGDDRLARAVSGPGHGHWHRTSDPGEWLIDDEQRGRGQVRAVAGEFEARVWRRQTGPTPAPELELTNGPQVFGDPTEAVGYVEANLFGLGA